MGRSFVPGVRVLEFLYLRRLLGLHEASPKKGSRRPILGSGRSWNYSQSTLGPVSWVDSGESGDCISSTIYYLLMTNSAIQIPLNNLSLSFDRVAGKIPEK